MRTFDGLKLGTIEDPNVRDNLRKINDYLRSVSGALSKSVFPGQQPPANPVPTGTSSTPNPPGQQFPQPVQGDMLYGLNTGTWTKLPIGTNNYLLTVNGGTPSWQPAPATGAPTTATYITQTHDATLSAEQALSDLATGLLKSTTGTGVVSIAVAADLPSHGAAQHDDRTRTLFIPAMTWFNQTAGSVATNVGSAPTSYNTHIMSGVSDTYLGANIVIPQDFTTGSAAWKLMFLNPAAVPSTNNTRWVLYYKVVNSGTSMAGSNDQTLGLTAASPGTQYILQTSTISTTITGIGVGDHVRLTLARLATDGADTNTQDMDFVGLSLDFTADM